MNGIRQQLLLPSNTRYARENCVAVRLKNRTTKEYTIELAQQQMNRAERIHIKQHSMKTIQSNVWKYHLSHLNATQLVYFGEIKNVAQIKTIKFMKQKKNAMSFFIIHHEILFCNVCLKRKSALTSTHTCTQNG